MGVLREFCHFTSSRPGTILRNLSVKQQKRLAFRSAPVLNRLARTFSISMRPRIFYVSPTGENSFGLPIAEAMACGLPIITSMHAGVAHSMRDGMDGSVFPNSMIFRSSHGCSSGFGRTKPCGEMPVMRRRPLTDGAGTGMPPTSGSCGRKLPARNLRLLHKDRMARPRISGPGGALRLLCVSLPA